MTDDARPPRPPRAAGCRLALALGAVLVLSACGEDRSPAPRANLVLIVIDTLRADRLDSYGFGEETAPEIDALARRGVRFARVIAQSSWTRPSIGSLLTSRYPRTLGIYDERGEILPAEFETLAELLARNGYTNLAATANPNINSTFNFQQGFDDYVDSTVRFDWMPSDGAALSHREAPLHGARDVFRALLERSEGRRPPLHLMATVMEVHEAFDPRVDLSEFEHLYRGRRDRSYLRAIRKVSREIGRFVDALAARPGWERTLFVVTSDHGEGLGSHPGVEDSHHHGRLLYESQVVVPLILFDTAGSLPAGRVIERPVRLLDLMPTLLELLAIEAPGDMAGVSLASLLAEPPDTSPAEPFVVETQFRRADSIGVYLDGWKYFEHRAAIAGADPRELQPPGGGENGSATNALALHPELATRLAAFLRDWEREHPRAEPTLGDAPLTEETERQLRSLGYLD